TGPQRPKRSLRQHGRAVDADVKRIELYDRIGKLQPHHVLPVGHRSLILDWRAVAVQSGLIDQRDVASCRRAEEEGSGNARGNRTETIAGIPEHSLPIYVRRTAGVHPNRREGTRYQSYRRAGKPCWIRGAGG